MFAWAIALAMAGICAIASFWVTDFDKTSMGEPLDDALATNFAVFREAVNAYAHEHRAEASFVATSQGDLMTLNMPANWQAIDGHNWQGEVRREGDGHLYCYVYGPATAGEVASVEKVLNHSLAVGWNDGGFMRRNENFCARAADCSPWPLPKGNPVPDGNLVSLVRIDEGGSL